MKSIFIPKWGPNIEKNWSYLNKSIVLWDINTKFLPVEDLIRIQLSSKFKRCCLKNRPAMPLTFSNFSRARQAHFLSYDLQIWWKVITFKGTYMIWFWFWYLSRYGIWKNVKSCTVHLTEVFGLSDVKSTTGCDS